MPKSLEHGEEHYLEEAQVDVTLAWVYDRDIESIDGIRAGTLGDYMSR